MKTAKIYALFMVLAITLSIVGFAYAHWADTIQIEGSVKIAHLLISIKSEKVLTSKEVEKYSEIEYQVSPDEHTLQLHCTNVKECWFVWIGLVTQNQGTLPANVKPPVYSYEDPNGFIEYFENKTYIYGPYPEETGYGKLEVWGNVMVDNQLKLDGTVNFPTEVPTPTPFVAYPGEKVVIWIWIHCKGNLPDSAIGKDIKLYIEIVDDLAI
ncbi:MAG: hypothetical protein OEX76_00070 [Candidatus Bathyarchaeota archaeon]|nr:hypothetical protein [Candidatus Bathyarchaeota archaeon]MDH5531846.1 hypothetical protein [Candidatus Bathyarchaeota archaeon]MDH5712370.1 hypothetical protein [Candidatus Bathyarchaeota archaeon]